MIYAKCYQREELYNYYKIEPNPVVVEVVSYLNERPHVRVDTYSRDTPGGRIEIDALLNHYSRIGKAEYNAAFARATENEFDVLS